MLKTFRDYSVGTLFEDNFEPGRTLLLLQNDPHDIFVTMFESYFDHTRCIRLNGLISTDRRYTILIRGSEENE